MDNRRLTTASVDYRLTSNSNPRAKFRNYVIKNQVLLSQIQSFYCFTANLSDHLCSEKGEAIIVEI